MWAAAGTLVRSRRVTSDSDEPKVSAPRLAWRALSRFRAHHMTDLAASLTYYAMMSLFPALLAAVSLLSLIGSADLAQKAADYLGRHGANPTTTQAIHDVLAKLTSTSASKSGPTFVIGLLLAINGASGAYGAAGRALNRVHGVEEDRSFVRRKLADLGATMIVLLLLVLVVIALFLGGQLATDVFGTIGLGDTGAQVWAVARWPAAIAGASLAYAIVYAYAPDLEHRRLAWHSLGTVTAVGIWILGSFGFGLFLQSFPRYGAAYGAFGTAIILLLWLFITANAFLYGAELNVTVRQERNPADGPPFLTPPPQPAAAAPAPPATSTSRPAPDT